MIRKVVVGFAENWLGGLVLVGVELRGFGNGFLVFWVYVFFEINIRCYYCFKEFWELGGSKVDFEGKVRIVFLRGFWLIFLEILVGYLFYKVYGNNEIFVLRIIVF